MGRVGRLLLVLAGNVVFWGAMAYGGWFLWANWIEDDDDPGSALPAVGAQSDPAEPLLSEGEARAIAVQSVAAFCGVAERVTSYQRFLRRIPLLFEPTTGVWFSPRAPQLRIYDRTGAVDMVVSYCR